MCKLILGGMNLPIKANESKIHLPKETRLELIKKTNNHSSHLKVEIFYHNQLLTGKIGYTDCFGGLTISKKKFDEMVKDLELILINEKKQEHFKVLPAYAS